MTLDEFFSATNQWVALIKCYRSIVVGRRDQFLKDWAVSDLTPQEFWDDWHDRHRTSMNDIGSRAMVCAAAIEASLKEKVK